MSVEIRPAEQLLRFDVACRLKTELPDTEADQRFPLGSSYRAHHRVEEASDGKLRLIAAGHLFEIESLPTDQQAAGPLVMEFDAWRIEPSDWLSGPLPRTVRWCYSVRQLG